MRSFICNSCKIDTPIDQDNHNGVCFTCSNHDKSKLRSLFDKLKEVSEIEFKTEAGQEIGKGINEALKIVKPYIIELSHRLK